jgi:hypothetical protein
MTLSTDEKRWSRRGGYSCLEKAAKGVEISEDEWIVSGRPTSIEEYLDRASRVT